MTERGCVVCPQFFRAEPRLYDRAPVCEPCRARLWGMPREILHLYATLDLERVRGEHQRVSGSREAPVPLNLDALDLSLRITQGSVSDPWGDQTGHLPVIVVLATWAQDWAEIRRENTPLCHVAELTEWLRNRTEWACDSHPAVDEYAGELHTLLGVLRRVTGTEAPRPERIDIPCRRCDAMTLFRHPGDDRVVCEHPDCRAVYAKAEWSAWTELLTAALVSPPKEAA